MTDKEMQETVEHFLEIQRAMNQSNNVLKVWHLKDSKKRFGDGAEYVGYDSWIDFWEKCNQKEVKITRCPCCNSLMMDSVGSHVIDEYENIYITPTCVECNSKAINDEDFRNTPFEVAYANLVVFNYSELEPLRHSK